MKMKRTPPEDRDEKQKGYNRNMCLGVVLLYMVVIKLLMILWNFLTGL